MILSGKCFGFFPTQVFHFIVSRERSIRRRLAPWTLQVLASQHEPEVRAKETGYRVEKRRKRNHNYQIIDNTFKGHALSTFRRMKIVRGCE